MMMLWVNKYKYPQWALLFMCLIFGFISCNNDQKNEEVATATATAATEAPVASEDINNQEKQTGQKVLFYIELNSGIACGSLISFEDTLLQHATYHNNGSLASRGNTYIGALHYYPDTLIVSDTNSTDLSSEELYFLGDPVYTGDSASDYIKVQELFSYEVYKELSSEWRNQYWTKFKKSHPYFFNRRWGNWAITGVVGSFETGVIASLEGRPVPRDNERYFIVTTRQINETVSGYGVCPVCRGTGVQYTNLGNRQRCYSCFGNGKSVETSGLSVDKWILCYLVENEYDTLGTLHENLNFSYGIVLESYPKFGLFCNSPDGTKDPIYKRTDNTDAEKIMELYNEFEQYILLAMPEKQEFYRKESYLPETSASSQH